MERAIYKSHKMDMSHWWFRARQEIVEELMSQVLDARQQGTQEILDIGSGSGGMLFTLKKFGKVTCIEPDAESLDQIRVRHGSSVVAVPADFFDVAECERIFSEKKFDVITMFDVIEHFERRDLVLERAYGMLKSGGILILTVPAFMFLWGRHDAQAHHKTRYLKSGLERQCAAAHFKKIRATYFNFFLFLPVAFARLIFEPLLSFFGVQAAQTDFEYGKSSKLLSAALESIFGFEKYVLHFLNLPFGVSIFYAAKKE